MPKVNLTDTFVRGSKCVTGDLVEWSDMKERGLSLRVTAAGVKSWTFRYHDLAGNRKRISLGRLDDVSLNEARAAAIAERQKLNSGQDPSTLRKNAKSQATASRLETVEEIGKRYFAEAVHGRHRPNGRPKREITITTTRRYFDKHIVPELGDESVKALTRGRLQTFIDGVADERTPGVARECRVVLQGIFTYAVWQELISANPVQFVSVQRIATRERVLTDAELKSVWDGVEYVADSEKVYVSRPLALAVQIAATTLQRRAEVTGMRKAELDLKAKLWTIPGDRTKNHRTHVVPLSDLAVRLISEAIGLSEESDFVFPSPRKDEGPILPASLSHAFRRVLGESKVTDIRPHDLRRTGATNLTSERIGTPRFIVSKVLNHVSDSGDGAAVTAIYDRNAYLPEKRKALDAWAALLMRIVRS
ncbi:tyrosine-type recombinase/integrase [Aureimonas sp. AU40]|uniref:tyrosine-type recombinase/integrase n=1 Tax=Aureimonas sp. AU40 TaxID=1637747 RepID=UPI00078574FA|nr:site-specific integrase [Aureimonas sp. AU40]